MVEEASFQAKRTILRRLDLHALHNGEMLSYPAEYPCRRSTSNNC
jgi:hypothetical protein